MEKEESTSLGAAILGAVSIGLYGSVEEVCNEFVKVKELYRPDKSDTEKYSKSFEIYKKIYDSLQGLYRDNSYGIGS